jgi:ATP-binding cassette subfamily F protein 3
MESFVERFRAQATKARQAQSRLKALERMQRIAPAHVDSPFEFSFAQPAKLPRPLLALENQAAGYNGKPLLEKVSLTLAPGARVALLGRNGAGKSTYMKLLSGELVGLAGTRTEARDLRIGYFAQHQLEQLNPLDSPLTNLRRAGAELAAKATEQELRDFLAGFGFRGDRVFEPGGPFSGGEKARLMLALTAYLRPNLMLLDEPTNHLDLEMRQALAVALQDYEGAVVLVSHDRHLLRTVADEFIVVHKGRATPFDGDLEDYAKWLNETDEAPASIAQPQGEEPQRSLPPAESAELRKQRKREEAERRNKLTPIKAKIAKCDADLARLAKKSAAIQAELAAPDIYAAASKDKLKDLLARQAEVARETEKVETDWLEASEEFEQQSRALD